MIESDEVIYGTIGMLPDGEFDPDKKYELLNLVSYDGSSYVVHTDPPKGTPPTDLNYWQVSALGTSKATADSVGTVKPDGTTTEVSTDGSLSVKTATQNTLGLVKGSNGITVGSDGSIDINTLFTQATELANIIAGEAIASVFGKVAKSIAVTMGLNENALLKNMLTNMDANDQNKVPTSAFVHTLWARIGMGEDLDIGANLTAVVKALNSNLSNTSSVTVTAPSGFGGTVNVELIKTGNQVDCRITVNNSGDIPSVTAITNVITEAYRPKTQVFIVLRKNNSDSTAAVMYSNTINAIRSTDQPISAGTWYGFAHWSTATY
jgi:hypothetical protein